MGFSLGRKAEGSGCFGPYRDNVHSRLRDLQLWLPLGQRGHRKSGQEDSFFLNRLFPSLCPSRDNIKSGQRGLQQLWLGCPTKLVSIRNNRKLNRNYFRHYPKQDVCFGCFDSISKQREPKQRKRNRNKPKKT
jgi:hypothetical protein